MVGQRQQWLAYALIILSVSLTVKSVWQNGARSAQAEHMVYITNTGADVLTA
jgi:methionine aminopeptidase